MMPASLWSKPCAGMFISWGFKFNPRPFMITFVGLCQTLKTHFTSYSTNINTYCINTYTLHADYLHSQRITQNASRWKNALCCQGQRELQFGYFILSLGLLNKLLGHHFRQVCSYKTNKVEEEVHLIKNKFRK